MTSGREIQEPPAILIVWDFLPANVTGAGILMRRLFEKYPNRYLWALTSSIAALNLVPHDPLPTRDRISIVPRLSIPRRFVGKIASWFNYLLIPLIVWRGVHLVRNHCIRVILTLPWNEYYIAAYLIHLFTGADLCVWVMDDPLGGRRWYDLRAPLYSFLFGATLRRARWVWGISPYMCEHLNRQYGCVSQPLMPFIDLAGATESCRPRLQGKREIHIVHTGAIYGLQLGAVRNLIKAVARANASTAYQKVRLTIQGSLSLENLRRMGLDAPYVILKRHVPPDEIPCLLGEADILFIGYSFDSSVKHFASTSLSTKLTEYLASGVPILLHAPPYSSLSRYCESEGFGLAVDEPDERMLADAILRLANDRDLTERLVRNAIATGFKNHRAAAARGHFFQSLCEASVAPRAAENADYLI